VTQLIVVGVVIVAIVVVLLLRKKKNGGDAYCCTDTVRPGRNYTDEPPKVLPMYFMPQPMKIL
jgi:hypothetical protein